VVFSAGYSIVHYEEGVGSLLSIFAPACLELGVVFLISKFFFMSEDAELQVWRVSLPVQSLFANSDERQNGKG
jgi:hypothetical protein